MSANIERARNRAGASSDALDPQAFVKEDENHFRAHTRAYTDPGVFEAEMERVFSKTWVYLAHESEIPGFLNGEFASYYQSLLERDGADEFEKRLSAK